MYVIGMWGCLPVITTGVVMSLESSEYTVYEDDQFVEVCVEVIEGVIRRTIPVTISTTEITAGIFFPCNYSL